MASRRPTDSHTSTAATSRPATSAVETPSAAKVANDRKPRASRAKKADAPKLQAPIELSEQTRRSMIAEAAYLRAERRGFTGGPEKEQEDWLIAESEVDALLKAGQGSSAQ
jgi:Protein of unknown function (DUF2934)